MRAYGTLTADHVARTVTGTLLPWERLGNTSRGPVSFARNAVAVPADLASVIYERGARRASADRPLIARHRRRHRPASILPRRVTPRPATPRSRR